MLGSWYRVILEMTQSVSETFQSNVTPWSERHPELVSGSHRIIGRSWNKFRMTLRIWLLSIIIRNASF